MNKKVTILLIILLTFICIAIRVPALDINNYHYLHPDDNYVVNPAVQIASNIKYNPKEFGLPDSTLFYSVGLSYKIIVFIKNTINATEKINIISEYKLEKNWLYIVVRFLNIIFVSGVIILLFLLTLRLTKNKVAASIASIALIFSSLFIEHIAYARPDILLSLFSLIFIWLCLNIYENGNTKYYLIAGGFYGLAVATKYPGVLLITPLLTAQLFRFKNFKKSIINKNIWYSILVGIAVFMLATPHFLFSLSEVKNDILYEAVREHGVAEGSLIGNFYFYIKTSFNYGIGTFYTFLSAITILIILFKKNKNNTLFHKNIIIIIFPFILFFSLIFHKLHWDRWMIPVLPFIALYGGYGINLLIIYLGKYGKNKIIFKFKNCIILLIISFVIFPVIVRGIKTSYAFTKFDTKVSTIEWIKNNFQKNTVIYLDQKSPNLNNDEIIIHKDFFLFEKPYTDYLSKNVQYLIINDIFTKQAISYEKNKPEFKQNYNLLLDNVSVLKIFPINEEISFVNQIHVNDWEILKNICNFQIQKGDKISIYKLY